jgi:hypothetical protein
MSEINSEIANKKRIILKNPDGTYSHCINKIINIGFKQGESDSVNNQIQIMEIKHENLSISDEELRYIIDSSAHLDREILVDELVEMYSRYRKSYLYLSVAELLLNVFLMISILVNNDAIITQIGKLYTDLSDSEAQFVFYLVYCASLVMNILFYSSVFATLFKKNIYQLKCYSYINLFLTLMTILQVYVHV